MGNTNKQSGITVGMRVERVDIFSTLIKLIIQTVLITIISMCAIGTAYLIINLADIKEDFMIIVLISVSTVIWMCIMITVLSHKKPIVNNEIQIDKNGNIAIKHENSVIRFNIVTEYKKKNLKLLKRVNSNIITISVPKLNNTYKLLIFSNNELNAMLQSVVNKFNIPIKVVQED